MRASVAGLAIAVFAVGSAHAQYMISAHSGVIQYVEGTAYLNDNQVQPRAGEFPNIKENQVFRTSEGMAEVLLTPGVFLRMGENTSIQMVSSKLTDTRVEVLSGSAMVECDDFPKDNAVTLLVKGNEILLVKHGLYRVDADQGLFKVYDGEAIAKNESGQVTLHKGKQTLLTGALMAENFDPKADDELYRWSDRRSGYLAKANVSSANSIVSGGSGYGGLGYGGLGYGGLGYAGLGYGGLVMVAAFLDLVSADLQVLARSARGSSTPCSACIRMSRAPAQCTAHSATASIAPTRFARLPFTTAGVVVGRLAPVLRERGRVQGNMHLSSRLGAARLASRGSSSTGGFTGGGMARGGAAMSTSSGSMSISSAGHSGGGASGGHGH